MHKLISLLILCSIPFVMNAQMTCCSATTEFASLGEKAGFRDAHLEPEAVEPLGETGEWVEFEVESGSKGRAYLIKSKVESSKYLFVFHEWWGLNQHILNEASRWSEILEGVNVMAIDLYDGKVANTREAASELMQNADEMRIRAIIEGAVDFVGNDASVATIGWCFGGGWSMQATLMLGSQAKACVIYYGMPEQDPEKLKELKAPVLGIFAEKDEWINHEAVGKYESAMEKAGKRYTTHWYEANHAFANPSNPIFNETATKDAMAKSAAFLKENL